MACNCSTAVVVKVYPKPVATRPMPVVRRSGKLAPKPVLPNDAERYRG